MLPRAARENISIRATTIVDIGYIRASSVLIVDDPQRAEAALTKAGMTVHLRGVLAVLIPDKPRRAG